LTINTQVKEAINDLKQMQAGPGGRRARTPGWLSVSPATPPVAAFAAARRDPEPAPGSGRQPAPAAAGKSTPATTALPVTPRPVQAHTGGDQAARAGEKRVNAGGDQGRDDYGLPPVDIQVPDDARELARDVQAYHRELRAERRRHLARRFYGPLTRDGMVLPLLAGCLALTLLAATLLTVFTARQATINLRPPGPRTGQATSSRLGAPLLNAMVYSGGQPMMLGSLPGAVLVLALIPPRCRCLSDLRELTVQAPPANIYLVGVRGERVEGWTRPLGLGAAHAVDDADYALPPRYQVTALTAVLVRRDGTGLRVIPDRHGFQIRDDVLALVPPGQPALMPATRKPATPTAGSSPTA